MRIRMKTLLAGPDEVIQPGRVVDLPEAQAQALVDGGYAEAVGSAPVEAAIAPAAPVETARVDVDGQAAPPEAAMAPEASADETMGAGDEQDAPVETAVGSELSPEKPAGRRGRSRK